MTEFPFSLYKLGETLSQNWTLLALTLAVLLFALMWLFREFAMWFLGYGSLKRELKKLRQEVAGLQQLLQITEPAAEKSTQRPSLQKTVFEERRGDHRLEL